MKKKAIVGYHGNYKAMFINMWFPINKPAKKQENH